MRIHQISMIILGLIWSGSLQGQTLIRSNAIPMIVQGDTLPNAWAGGIQSPQISHIDLDNDGKQDLLVFDRQDNRILPFLRVASGSGGLRYAPEFISSFPAELHNWVLCADYDQDGMRDIFCGSAQGSNIQVFNNISLTSGPLQFQSSPILLYSTYPPYLAIYSAANDLPAISDADFDGDLDILTFNVGGSFVEWHKNLSQELHGNSDSLLFEVNSRCFGHFQESSGGCTATIGLAPCGIGEIQSDHLFDLLSPDLHVGSTMLALDLDADSLSDLLVGDVGCHDVYSLHNAGTREIAHFDFVETGFPSQSTPINVLTFPAMYNVDLDDDGLLDLLSAPNTPSSSEDARGLQWHRNVGTQEYPDFVHQGYGFLQSQMLELGTGAHPALFDYDADGLIDLLVGSLGKYDSTGNYLPGLQLFRNTGTLSEPSFTLASDDYLGFRTNLSLPQTPGLTPATGDLDNDGDQDLLIGNQDGTIMYFTNMAPPGGTASYTLSSTQFAGIDVGLNSAPHIYDWDKDQKPDLLIGNAKGRIVYYRNVGSPTNPTFSLVTDSLGRIKINDASGLSFTNGFAKPFMADIDKDLEDELLVGTVTGHVQVYEVTGLPVFASFPRQADLGALDFGSFSAPAAAKLDQYGNSYLVGTLRGGIELVQDPRSVSSEPQTTGSGFAPIAFPNPFTTTFTLALSHSKGITHVSVYDVWGRRIYSQGALAKQIEIDGSTWGTGLYFISIESLQGAWSAKVMKAK